jgi:Protein of unknown function (DUF3617)
MTKRKLIGLAAAMGLAAAVLLAQGKFTPMNVKTGLWQSTSTVKMSGSLGIPPDMASKLTPEQRARYEASMKQYANQQQTSTSKSCVTKEQLSEDPFAQKDAGDTKCKEKLIRSTTSDAEIQQTCAGDQGTSSDIHMTLHAQDREHVNGSGQVVMTMGGRTMKSDVTFRAKWVQESCPKDVD